MEATGIDAGLVELKQGWQICHPCLRWGLIQKC